MRVSDGPAAVFCRDEHPMIASGEFVPPSRLVPMRTSEFTARLRRRGGACPGGVGDAGAEGEPPPPLFYCSAECATWASS